MAKAKKNNHNKSKRKIDLLKPFKWIKGVLLAEIPSYLSKKYYGQMVLGGIMLFLGISIMPFARSITLGLFPVLIGICLIGMGIAYKGAVLKGFVTVEGVIIERTKFLPGRNVADGYTLQTSGGQIHIPTTKRKGALPIGTKLRVYISKSSTQYERNGTTNYGNVFGFDVIIDEETSAKG